MVGYLTAPAVWKCRACGLRWAAEPSEPPADNPLADLVNAEPVPPEAARIIEERFWDLV